MNCIQHKGIEFAVVPAGSFRMGLGLDEEKEARRICPEPRIWWDSVRPTQDLNVTQFEISSAPITVQQLVTIGHELATTVSRRSKGSTLARLTWDEAKRVANDLGGRLPTEVEWEYACRAGTTGLFPFGELPREAEILAPWMSWDGATGPRNQFGLRTLFTGEWCIDTWRQSHADPSTEEPGVAVVRGGGAYFWPWQDEEWVWCMSATRSPSTELPEPYWSFRVVVVN
jgi:formylglycine-generating enzyme required for sulfatase activity